MHDAPEPPETRTLVGSALVVYLLMSLIGVWLIAWSGQPVGRLVFGDGTRIIPDTLAGTGAGLGVVLITWLLRRWPPVKALNDELSAMLGRPGTVAIAVLAVTSAVGEELLFRGGLQAWIGFWLTAAIFGLLHGGTSRRLRAWALFAFGAGLLLGALTLWTGNLLAAILCHLTVNYFNLHVIAGEASA